MVSGTLATRTAIRPQRVSGEDLRQADAYEGQFESVISGSRSNTIGFTVVEWDIAQRERGNLLRAVEVELDPVAAHVAEQVDERRDVRIEQRHHRQQDEHRGEGPRFPPLSIAGRIAGR